MYMIRGHTGIHNTDAHTDKAHVARDCARCVCAAERFQGDGRCCFLAWCTNGNWRERTRDVRTRDTSTYATSLKNSSIALMHLSKYKCAFPCFAIASATSSAWCSVTRRTPYNFTFDTRCTRRWNKIPANLPGRCEKRPLTDVSNFVNTKKKTAHWLRVREQNTHAPRSRHFVSRSVELIV